MERRNRERERKTHAHQETGREGGKEETTAGEMEKCTPPASWQLGTGRTLVPQLMQQTSSEHLP